MQPSCIDMSRVTSFVRDRELPNNVKDQRLRVHRKMVHPCHQQRAHLRQVLRYCPEELPVCTWCFKSKSALLPLAARKYLLRSVPRLFGRALFSSANISWQAGRAGTQAALLEKGQPFLSEFLEHMFDAGGRIQFQHSGLPTCGSDLLAPLAIAPAHRSTP